MKKQGGGTSVGGSSKATMSKQDGDAGSAGEKLRSGSRFWRALKNTLIVCGALVVLAAPVVIADACSGMGSQKEQEPESQLFSTNPVDLEPGLAVVRMSHQGEGDFVVNLISADPGEAPEAQERIEFFGDRNGGSYTRSALALALEKGSADITRAIGIQNAGTYVFDVKADGPWTLHVEQPQPSSAPEPARFSGDDDTATPLFQLSGGPKDVAITNPAGGEVRVALLDRDGNEIENILMEETKVTDEEQPESVSTIDVPEDGIYLFDVHADSLWTVEISDTD